MAAGTKKDSRNKQRRKNAGIVLALLFLAQALMMGAVIAQTMPASPQQGQYQSNPSNLTGDAAQTQSTIQNPYIDAKGFIPAVNDSSNINVQGGANQYGSTPGIKFDANQILKMDNAYGVLDQQGVQRPQIFIPGQQVQQSLQQGVNPYQQNLQNASLLSQQQTSLVMQSAEQGGIGNPQGSVNNVLSQSLGSVNDTYRGMHQWFNDDIIGNLFSQIGQLIGKWISEVINGWIADTVQFLAAFLRVFVLNPNIAVNGLNGSPNDGISPYIRQGADVMYGIAVDLLLLLFILAIWKYWAEAAWRGAGNLMGAVGRLIFTAGLMLAFPTLYAFEIQITNEMIKAIYFNSTDQIAMLDSALASAVRGGILSGVGGLASAFAPLLGGVGLGIAGGLVGEVFAFAGLVIFLVLGGILIAELIYILVLKAIQTALLTAQYMFAPIFLVFFATPDTENVATGFVKAWVETSLWTFVWVGLLKIMVIIMFSDYNPWGKILMSVGVLQMMIQVPTFLARAQISPMSDFVSAGLITGGLLKMFGWMGSTASSRLQQGLGYYLNDRIGQQGFPQTTRNPVTGLATETGPTYDKLKSLRDKAKQDPTKSGPTTPGAGADMKKTPMERAGLKTDKNGNLLGADGKPILGKDGKPLKMRPDGTITDSNGKPLSTDQLAALGLGPPPPKKDAATGGAGGAGGGGGRTDTGLTPAGTPRMNSKGELLDPTTGKPFKKGDDGRLIDPLTGQPITGKRAQQLGITTDGKLIDPQTKKPLERNADGKIVDPQTGRPITKERAAEFGITPDGKPLKPPGQRAAAGQRLERGPDGKLVDPHSKQEIPTDADGKVVDPTTGEKYTVNEKGQLVDSQGKTLDAKEQGRVIGNIVGNGPAPKRQAAPAPGGQPAAKDPAKMTDKELLDKLSFRPGYTPTKADKDKFISLVRGGAAVGAAAAAAFGGAAAWNGAASVMGANGQPQDVPVDADGKVVDPSTGEKYSVNDKGQLVDSAGKVVSADKQGKIIASVLGNGPRQKGAVPPPQDPRNMSDQDLMKGLTFRSGFTPTQAQKDRFISLVRGGVGVEAAANMAFNNNATFSAPSSGGSDSQQAGGSERGGAEQRTVTVPEERGRNMQTGGGRTDVRDETGKTTRTAGGATDNRPWTFRDGFRASAAQTDTYLRLIQNGADPAQAAAQAFGTANILANPAAQLTTNVPPGVQTATAQVGTQQAAQQGRTHVQTPQGQPQQQLQQQQQQAQQQQFTPRQVQAFNQLVSAGVPAAFAAAIATTADPSAGGGGGGAGGVTPPGGGAPPATPPGGLPPTAAQDAFRRIAHLKNPTPGDLDQSGLWMVAGARNPVGDVRNLKLQIRQNQGKNGKVWGSTRGGYSRIDLPDNATPAQIAGMFAVAGYAQEIENDPAAMDAARVAAVQSGAHRPKGFLQGAAANLNAYFGGNWASTGLGKQQFNNAMYSAAVEGAQGYVTGQGGNAYTQYLRQRYGSFDRDRMDTLTLIATDPEAAESAWNAGIVQATDRLVASGTKITAANRGAALNPYVASLRPQAAGAAIRAMVLYGMHDSRMEPPTGMTREEWINSGEGGMLMGEILRDMNPEKARALHAIYNVTGGADLNDQVLDAVTSISMQNNVPPEVGYRILSGNLGDVAQRLTGNTAFAGARSIEQVHAIASQQYGTQHAAPISQHIFSVATSTAQMGMRSLGRGAANATLNQILVGGMDEVLAEQGGIAAIANPNNVIAQDKAESWATAVGIASARLGSHATTVGRAKAVFKYIQDGNPNAGSLSGQEIVIAERLQNMGAGRITQSMVQVLRNLDAEGTSGVDLTTVQDIAAQVDAGNARADQAYAVSLVRNAGYKVSRPAVEIAASLDSMDAYSPDTFRVVASLVSSGVVQNASSAPTVFTTAVAKAANDAGIDVNQPLNQVLAQLEAQSGGATNAGTIAADIANIKVQGGFEDRQLVDPVLFEAAYDAMHDPTASAHRVQSIRITERIHGHGAVKDPGVLSVYDDMLEAGIDPGDLTDDYVGLQRYYAASALRDARHTYGLPPGKSMPTPSTRMLDRIRTDPRFNMSKARPQTPPKMPQSLFYDLLS